MMLKHSVYFDGAVQSVGFERLGRRATVGVIAAGEYHFGTDGAERMTVVSGTRRAPVSRFRRPAVSTLKRLGGRPRISASFCSLAHRGGMVTRARLNQGDERGF